MSCLQQLLSAPPPSLHRRKPLLSSVSPRLHSTPSPICLCCSNSSLHASSPSRPVVILPGLGNNKNDYQELKSSLETRGLPTTVVEISRPDWLRNALGLLDKNYWTGKLTPRPVLDWYFDKMNEAIAAAKASGETKVSLVGHSAGGWLARVYMSEFGIDDIAMLLSLGTPHLYDSPLKGVSGFIWELLLSLNLLLFPTVSEIVHRPPPKGVPGVIDQTRGLLDYVNEVCPANCFAPDVTYVCVAGRFLKGERFFPRVSAVSTASVAAVNEQQLNVVPRTSTPEEHEELIERNSTIQARIVGQGYKQVCGQADVWGDGVVPEISAHLDGAQNITLDGVYHSPVGARVPERPWYGSEGVLEQWVHHLH